MYSTSYVFILKSTYMNGGNNSRLCLDSLWVSNVTLFLFLGASLDVRLDIVC